MMLRVVEAFSGIGSQARALKNINIKYSVLNTIEWDIYATYAYDIIHNGVQNLKRYEHLTKEEILLQLKKYTLSADGKAPINFGFLSTWSEEGLKKILCAIDRTHNLCSITDVKASDLPENIDLFTYSFPCQDLSICGSWHGNMSGIDRNAHNRSGMLWEVERILKELHCTNRKLPKFLLMENVSNILSRIHKANFEEWKDILTQLGYVNQVYTLDASKFGIPQRRKRTYMLSVLCTNEYGKKKVEKYFAKNNLEESEKQKLKPLSDIVRIDYNNPTYKVEADRSNPNDTPSRRKILADNGYVYSTNGEFVETINTLTTKQDRNPTAGLLYYPQHQEGKMEYRNFTPRECFMLMGFEEIDYEILEANNFYIKRGHKLIGRERYEKFAGNSIVVNVLMEIFKQVDKIRKMRGL